MGGALGAGFEQFVTGRGEFRIRADWHIGTGSKLALIGPSGSGKSMFLNAIAGFETCYAGKVMVEGTDVTDMEPADRPVTLMFQDHNLFPHLTVFQNIALGIDPGLRLDDAARDRVEQVMTDVELSGLNRRYPSELSGGQQSRAALARALIRARPLLLLDEPFAALGPGMRRDMLALVLDTATQAGMTLIFVTHNPEDAQMAPLTSLITDGAVAPPRVTAELFANPPEALRRYL